jgi:phosphate transport system protein
MTYYKERLERDLKTIRNRLLAVAEVVRDSVAESVDALIVRDQSRLYQVMLNDPQVNRETNEIDALCHAFIARHLPAAGYLRFVSSALRLTIALERIGDYAVTVSRVGVRLETIPPQTLIEDLQEVSRRSCKMLHQAIIAFVTEDTELAKETAQMSRKIDKRHDKFFEKVISGQEPLLLHTIRLLTIMGKLERVSDQAKNICEEVFFTTTGEGKETRIPKILFVDEKNSLYSQLAVALATKAFPNSGKYKSCGWNPAESIDPSYVKITERFGLINEPSPPTKVQPFRQAMAKYKLIITINGGEAPPLPMVPFHSILLNWEINVDCSEDEIVQQLSVKIQDLMFKLRGEDAD